MEADKSTTEDKVIETVLPVDLRERAYRASNGEWAWRKEDAISAALQLAAAGLACLGGEAWIAQGGGRWNGLIPRAGGGPDSVYSWCTTPAKQQPSETWSEFCERGAREASEALRSLGAEVDAVSTERERIVWCLTWVTAAELADLH